MSKKSIYIFAGAGLFLALATGAIISVSAQTPNFVESREQINQAIQNNDYEAWKQAVVNSPRGEEMLSAVDTAEDFAKLVEAHGYSQKAREIRAELGIDFRQQARENIEAAKVAIQNNDYEAWKQAVVNSPRGEEMLSAVDTAEDFAKLVEAHNARESGDFEKAKTIAEELGLPQFGKGIGQGSMRSGQGHGQLAR